MSLSKQKTSGITLRPGTKNDAAACGKICFDAFTNIAAQHNFTPEFSELAPTTEAISTLLNSSGIYSVIAELNGDIIGSNFLDERDLIVGVGPISINPDIQNSGAGRLLMQDVIDRSRTLKKPGIRLCTAAHHARSVSLYSKLGFQIREPLVVLQGQPIKKTIGNISVRPATSADISFVSKLSQQIHGHDSQQEFTDAITQGTAMVAERDGHITGYTSGVSFFGRTSGETNEDVKALIAAGKEYAGIGFLLPSRNHELLTWCLANNLKVIISMVHMTMGLYNKPQGTYLPSILY